MKIKKLEAENFRNLEQVSFQPHPCANILYGNNAQGKTNLLEAVWLFTGSRSFRGGKENEFVRFGTENTSLRMDFSAQGRDQQADLHFGGGKKAAFLNGIKQDRPGNLAGVFCAVVFSPDHLFLIKQGPENRRKMLDVSLCQALPKYAKILDSYHKILKQRASLLKDISRHAGLLDLLDVWDKSLVDYGAYITRARVSYVRKLRQAAAEIYAGIAKEKEDFDALYQPVFGQVEEGFSKEDYREVLGKAVAEGRGEDIRLGTTTMGPHRDDLEILIDGKSARSFGSQGQQRSCVLALKLAECGILEERNGESPVVMLDDVMSELDEERRGYLLNQLRDRQVLITCCDAGAFAGLRDGAVFHVEQGRLTPG